MTREVKLKEVEQTLRSVLVLQEISLCEKCSNSEIFWSLFSCFRTEVSLPLSDRIRRDTSVQMRENRDQNNSEYGHFLCSVCGFIVTLFLQFLAFEQSCKYMVLEFPKKVFNISTCSKLQDDKALVHSSTRNELKSTKYEGEFEKKHYWQKN